MTREELREHCEKQVEACLDWHRVHVKPLGLVYEEHKLVLDLLDQDDDKEKRIEELLESLQTANKTNETLIKLLEDKQEHCEELFDDWHEAPSYAMTLEQAREAVHELRKENVKLRKEPCEDAVSRKEVFETFGELLGIWGRKALMELPSVTPTHKKGKWIEHISNMNFEDVDNFYDEDWDGTTHECSSCHATYFYMTDFCPNCGADMRGSEDGSN